MCVCVCVYIYTLFIHLSLGGHLICFISLAIVNSGAMLSFVLFCDFIFVVLLSGFGITVMLAS